MDFYSWINLCIFVIYNYFLIFFFLLNFFIKEIRIYLFVLLFVVVIVVGVVVFDVDELFFLFDFSFIFMVEIKG